MSVQENPAPVTASSWKRLLPNVPFFLSVLVFAVLYLRSEHPENPDTPMTRRDLQTLLGCYTNGKNEVKVTPDMITATNGVTSVRSAFADFRYFRLFGVSTDVELVLNETGKFEPLKNPRGFNYVFEGSEENRFLLIPQRVIAADGKERTMKLYRRPC